MYACHGCLKEESIIGSDYSVLIWLSGQIFQKASETDQLSDTVDYVHLHNIVKEEMKIPSKLLGTCKYANHRSYFQGNRNGCKKYRFQLQK